MRLRAPIVLLLVLAITGVPAIAEFYTDWLWFKEVGYEHVFLRSLTIRALVAALAGLAAFAMLAGNLIFAMRALRPRPFMVATPQGPQTITMDPKSLKPLVLLGAAFLALMIGLFAGGQWESWLYFIHGGSFGKADPILGRDIGFYVFTLPFLELVHGLLYFTCFLMIAVAFAAYLFGGEVGLEPAGRIYVSRRATRHLGLLAAAMLLTFAFSAWLQIPSC